MEKIEIHSDFIYKFKAPAEILRLGKTLASEARFSPGTVRVRQVILTPDDGATPLINWFNKCLEEVKTDLKLICGRLETTLTWVNRSESGEWHHLHRHPNSWASGIFYLSESPAKTWLSKRSHWFPEQPVLELRQDEELVIEKVTSEPGKLIVFPSWIPHSVTEHFGPEPRYTISFNSFPLGQMGNSVNLTTMNLSHNYPEK